MPPPCDPTALHQAFATSRPLNWGEKPPSLDEITERHGKKATNRSLELLEQAATVEPQVTDQFLDALPTGTSPYQLDRRVKSPESLARKMADWNASGAQDPIDDLLRYTVLTASADELVAAARRTVDAMNDHEWRVRSAMHSYTEGSRYKGIHASLEVNGAPNVEVQFHSVASAKVKELTTPWYQVERSSNASLEDRLAARQQCVEASATLKPPYGIDGLTQLGGQPVDVNNYSDSRKAVQDRAQRSAAPTSSHARTLDRNDGIAR